MSNIMSSFITIERERGGIDRTGDSHGIKFRRGIKCTKNFPCILT